MNMVVADFWSGEEHCLQHLPVIEWSYMKKEMETYSSVSVSLSVFTFFESGCSRRYISSIVGRDRLVVDGGEVMETSFNCSHPCSYGLTVRSYNCSIACWIDRLSKRGSIVCKNVRTACQCYKVTEKSIS